MTTTRIKTGATEPIRVLAVDKKGAPLTLLTDLFVRLERESDGLFLDWADLTFKSSLWTTKEKPIVEVDATNLPGVYEVVGRLDFSALTNKVPNDDYTVFPLQTPGTNAFLSPPGAIQEGDWVDESLAANQFADGSVWMNRTLGAAGTLFPLGTIGNPSDNLTDAIAIMANEKLSIVSVSEGNPPLALPGDFKNGFFRGFHRMTTFLGLNDKNVDGSVFERVTVFGAAAVADQAVGFRECALTGFLANIRTIWADDCILLGSISIAAGGTAKFSRLTIGSTATPVITVSGVGNNAALDVIGGSFQLAGTDDAGIVVVISLSGGAEVEVLASCTAGTIIVYGNGNLINNGTGTVDVQDKRQDARLSTAHGPGSWEGISTGARQITVTVEDQLSVGVPDAIVDIYDAANTVFITRARTNPSGDVVIALDDATYSVRLHKAGFTFTVPETLVVTADASVTFSGVAFVAPAPSAPNLCVIFGNVDNAAGVPIAGACVEAFAEVEQSVGGFQKSERVASTLTDVDGAFQIELVRTASVRFKITDPDDNVVFEQIKVVPDLASQDLATWP